MNINIPGDLRSLRAKAAASVKAGQSIRDAARAHRWPRCLAAMGRERLSSVPQSGDTVSPSPNQGHWKGTMTFLRNHYWLPLTVAYVGLLAAAALIGEVL